MGIYDELGVKCIINGAATLTALGGSIMPPEVLEAMTEASKSYVPIIELQHKVGAQIAKWTNNEAAMVSNGAAAGMVLATAACIAGDDEDKRRALPHTEGMKNEVLVYGPQRVGYDFAIHQAGGKIVEYGSPDGTTEDQLEAAITDKTVGIFVFYFEHRMDNQLPLEKVVEIAHKRDIPVIVDAAAQLPRRENLWRFTRDLGADVALFSGGKGLCGPQSSGLVVGKKEYIDRMITFSCPNPGIGRPMKVGKEEIIGLMTAVKLYMEKDMEAEMECWEAQVQSVLDAFRDESAVCASRDFPSEAGQPMPRAKVSMVEGALNADITQIDNWLKEGQPSIFLAVMGNALYINPQTLQPGEMDIIIQKIKEAMDKYKK
ncbi:MAG TPA: aminotransferase class V-fold PLP-dependent enzyme [Clostridia bacterium]|nr:aminotransferase class V-fold PLP-dependent enzyme [Clostridia bacterium]